MPRTTAQSRTVPSRTVQSFERGVEAFLPLKPWSRGAVCLGALLLASTTPHAAGARATLAVSMSGPRADDATRQFAARLGALGVKTAPPPASPSGRGGARGSEGTPHLRGAITQLQGTWALRLVLEAGAGRVALRRSYPLRGARLDPATVQQAAQAVAAALRRGSSRRKTQRRAPPAELPRTVVVPFERRGTAIVVPVVIRGPAGDIRVKMIYDTGATFTTLSASALDKLGALRGDVTMQSSTANGIVQRSIAVVEGMALGSAEVDGLLTVSECNACAGGGIEGLLGLNFSRHFVTTVDHEAGRIVLEPKRPADADTFDISPFLKLVGVRNSARAGKLVSTFVLRNGSPVALRDVVVSLRTAAAPTVVIQALGPGAEAEAELVSALPRSTRTPALRLVSASWGARPDRPGSHGKKAAPPVVSTETPIFVGREAVGSSSAREPEQAVDDLGFIVSPPGP